MARMRTIKPEFWTDSKIVTLSAFARLLYIGMWNFALCDHGHLEDDPIRLKLQILPMDSIEIGPLLDELLESSRINRIQTKSGDSYLYIPSMKRNQKGDPRWKSRCPACNDAEFGSTGLPETLVSLGEKSGDSSYSTQATPEYALVEERRVEEGLKDLSIDESIDGKKNARPDLNAEFSQWYSKYPRKEAKAAALKAFIKVRKNISLEVLVSGLQRYSVSIAGKERQHIALPATWLNAGRWEDEYGPLQTTDGPAVPNMYRMFNN